MSIRNQRIMMGTIALCLLLSGIFFYYNNIKIPKVRQQLETTLRKEIDENVMDKQWVAVVTSPSGISHYTQMTEEIIHESIALKEVPLKYVVEGSIGDLDIIKGMITKYPLNNKQQLLWDQFYTEENWYGEMERLKEFQVASLVADEVKTGNIVDVIINYGNGDYDVVVPKIKVRKIVNNDDHENSKRDNYTIVLAVDELQFRDLYLAEQLGKFETRLYLDSNQPPSIITFNYQDRIGELILQKITDKTTDNITVPIEKEEDKISYPVRNNE